jgi:hypothetical protein
VLITNLTIALVNIENPEMAIACLVVKTKNVMHIGVTTPPPPIPPMVDKAMSTDRTIRPRNS